MIGGEFSMCVAVPGKIVEINETNAKVDFNGNILQVNIGLVKAKLDDFVLVHAGCAIEILKKEMAEEIIELFKVMEELVNE